MFFQQQQCRLFDMCHMEILLCRARRWRAHPCGTYGIIGANVAVWGLYKTAPEAPRRLHPFIAGWPGTSTTTSWSRVLPDRRFWAQHFFSSYHTVRQGRLETIPLCSFMHVDDRHLLFNMLALFFFGRQIEGIIGMGRFLFFYMGSTVTAVSAQLFACKKQHQPVVQCFGASGGVYAALAWVTCFMPQQTVWLFLIIPMPIWVLTGGLLALDILRIRPNEGHTAHVVGAFCGAAAYFWRLRRWR